MALFKKAKITPKTKYYYRITSSDGIKGCKKCLLRHIDLYSTKSLSKYCKSCLYDLEQTDPDFAVGLEAVENLWAKSLGTGVD